MIQIIKRALLSAEQGNRDKPYAIAAETGVAWIVKDDNSCIRLALFGCKVLRLIWPYRGGRISS
jgi:hypothetical protein